MGPHIDGVTWLKSHWPDVIEEHEGANATMAGVALSLAAGSLPGGAALRSWGPVAATALSLIGLGAVLAVWIPRLARLHAEQRTLGGTPALGTRAGGWRLGGVVYFAPCSP
jgi:hypothetical protein